MTPNFNYFSQRDCRRVAPLLFAQSTDAKLSPRDLARLNAHLASCVSCRREAAQLAAVGKMLRASVPTAPLPAPDLWSRIEAEIAPQNGNAPLPSGRPIVRRAPFVPALGGMAWAGSFVIGAASVAWMTFGGGFWGLTHHAAQTNTTAGLASLQHEPAALTLLSPAAPAPSAASAQTKAAKAIASRPVASAADTIAANRAVAKAKNMMRKATPVWSPRVDPFAPLASETHHSARKLPSAANLASVSVPPRPQRFTAAAPAAPRPAPTTAESIANAALASPQMPVVSTSDTLAAIAASAAGSAPNGEAPAVADLSATAAPTKTVVASAVYANRVTASAPANALAASASSFEETARNVPPTSGAGTNGAFSVADAAARAQRQRALFSYSRP